MPTPPAAACSPDPDVPLGTPVAADDVEFIVTSPLLESRRVRLDAPTIIHMVSAQMLRAGVDADRLARTRWLWIGTDNGPELVAIFPGNEA